MARSRSVAVTYTQEIAQKVLVIDRQRRIIRRPTTALPTTALPTTALPTTALPTTALPTRKEMQ
jgi:hypothetical protein